jgi:hypothetical protein
MGAMVSALIGGAAFEDVVAPSFWHWGDLHPAIADIAGGSWRGKQPPAIRGTGYCVDALEAALWSVDGAVDFRDAVLRAANLGDDADTTAAIAGQLAGARWGVSTIPAEWREKVVAGERMVSLARGLFVAGGGDAGSAAWAHDPFVHAWWVEPGQLLAGEYPGHPSPARARQKVDLLVDAGVRTFVDLTTPADRLAPYEALVAEVAGARRLDLRHVSFPIPDLSVVDDDRYDEVCRVIEDGRRRGVVYVHCWGGVGRTATVIGCVLAGEGLSYDQIVARLVALREGSRKAHRRAPETSVQYDLIRRRVARRR